MDAEDQTLNIPSTQLPSEQFGGGSKPSPCPACRGRADSQPFFLVSHLISFKISTEQHRLGFEMQTLSIPLLLTTSAQSFSYTPCIYMKIFFSDFIAVPLLRQCSEITWTDQKSCPDLAYASPDPE